MLLNMLRSRLGLYRQEYDGIFEGLKTRATALHKAFGQMEGVECGTPQGSMYLFPTIKLSAKAAEAAAAEGLRRSVEAQEAERARVARELHDESGQVLTALALHLKALEEDVGPGDARDRIVEMRRSLASASSSLRELATRLRPSAVEEHGLEDAIEDQAARLRRAGVTVDVDVRGLGADLPEEIQTVLFRVVQESLTNVARHSGAEHASVVVSTREGRLRLMVEDDGCGFDTAAPTARLGLAGIRERVELLGGHLRIESSVDGGTAVVVDLET
jgi:signal transduction histidine kinase